VGPRPARAVAGLPAHPRMVGPYPHHHLPGASAGQPSGRAALRARHVALALLDDLVSVGFLDDQHCHHGRRPAACDPRAAPVDLDQPGPGPAMSDAAKPWPPLIVAKHTPRWVRWRDFALTLMMWILFAIMLETEFELFAGGHLERWGFGDFDTD